MADDIKLKDEYVIAQYGLCYCSVWTSSILKTMVVDSLV